MPAFSGGIRRPPFAATTVSTPAKAREWSTQMLNGTPLTGMIVRHVGETFGIQTSPIFNLLFGENRVRPIGVLRP